MSEQRGYEKEAQAKLSALLTRVPSLSVGADEVDRTFGLRGPFSPDLVLPVQVGNQHWRLMCVVKPQAQPREVRMTVLLLKDRLTALKPENYLVLLAPYISSESAGICREQGVGYADFAGNCYLNFGTVFIERSGMANTRAEKRGLRSIFAPKSARILRQLFREPARHWRVAELSKTTATSLGQVSNVRKALIEQEWAAVSGDGLKLVRPGALLDAWRDAYAKRRVKRNRYYTILHGAPLDRQIKTAMDSVGSGAHALLASYSAAHWLAPFARYPTQIFYADEAGETLLREQLQLEPASKGENVLIERLADDGIFADRIEAAPGLWSTGLIQTYLDLAASGERGGEAAEHLRQTRIEPSWKAPA
jgi:Transcriptional regulator, AbiEi antitoxin, Type IV TA system